MSAATESQFECVTGCARRAWMHVAGHSFHSYLLLQSDFGTVKKITIATSLAFVRKPRGSMPIDGVMHSSEFQVDLE